MFHRYSPILFIIVLALLLAAAPAYAVQNARGSSNGNGVQIWFAAEDYDVRDPDTDEFFLFVAQPGSLAATTLVRAGADGGMINWTFDIRAAGGSGGTWYFWARAINPSNNSDYMMVDGDPDDPIPAGPPYPGGDGTAPFDNDAHRVFEENVEGGGFGWQIAGHDQGHTKDLQDGVNTMYLFHRQGNDSRFLDIFMWTDDPDYVPTDADYEGAGLLDSTAVEPVAKLSITWGSIKKRL